MTSLHHLRDVLVQDIERILGVEVIPNGKMRKAIDFFIGYLESKGVTEAELITLEVVGAYRLYLRVYAERDDEEPLVSAAGALLSAAVVRGLIVEEICQFYAHIAPIEFFTKSKINDCLN